MTINEMIAAAKSKVGDVGGWGSVYHPNGRLACRAWGVSAGRKWTVRADFELDGKKISRATAAAFLSQGAAA